MAKGKPTNKIAKGANGRKNHGPKRFLHHDIYPKATRMDIASSGALSKYDDFSSFCLAMQARGVRSDLDLMWGKFKSIKMIKNANGEWIFNRVAQDQFFKDAKNIASQLAADSKRKKKGAKA